MIPNQKFMIVVGGYRVRRRTFFVGNADEDGQRTISYGNGRMMSSSFGQIWVVKRLYLGEQMVFHPAGKDFDTHHTEGIVVSMKLT